MTMKLHRSFFFAMFVVPLSAIGVGELSPRLALLPPPARAPVHPSPPAPELEPLPSGLLTGKATVNSAGTLAMKWLPSSGITERQSVIKLWGIDAPRAPETCSKNYAGDERGFVIWRCGQQSTEALKNLIGVRDVLCRYRWAFVNPGYECWLDEGGGVGRNINRWAVQLGWSYAGAVGIRSDELVFPYINEQAMARNHQAGVWDARFRGSP